MFKFNFHLIFIHLKKQEGGLGKQYEAFTLKQYVASTLKPLAISSTFPATLRSFSFSLFLTDILYSEAFCNSPQSLLIFLSLFILL